MNEWKVEKLKEILKLCEPENSFNADETGLFWQLLPEKSLGFIDAKQHGDKKNKNGDKKTRLGILHQLRQT